MKQITWESFYKETVPEGLHLLVFTRKTCAHCRALEKNLEIIEAEESEKLRAGEISVPVSLGEVDVEEEASLASQFDIMSVPTILYLKENNVIDRQVGAYPVAFLRDSIRRLR